MNSKYFGFSLIEILISLFLLSLILLSIDAMEITALRKNKGAYFFNIAAIQFNSMRERLVALQDRSGLSEEIVRWNQQNQEVLPQGNGIVSGHFPSYTLTLYWGKWNKKNCTKTALELGGCITEQMTL